MCAQCVGHLEWTDTKIYRAVRTGLIPEYDVRKLPAHASSCYVSGVVTHT